MLHEFCRILRKYWFFMVIKLISIGTTYLASLDVNWGGDTSGKNQWVEQEEWRSLINATKYLTDDEKTALLKNSLY